MGQKSAQRAQKSLNKDQVSFKLLMESTIMSFKLLMESTILSSKLLMESTILSSELLMESTHFKFQPPTYWELMGVYYCQPQLVNLNLVNTFGYIGVLDEFTRSLVKRYLWWYLVVLFLLVNLYLVNTFEYVGVLDEFTRSLVSKDLWWYLVELVLVLVTIPAQLRSLGMTIL